MPMVIRQVAVGKIPPSLFRRSRACLSGMYFHAVSVVPYVPSRAAGGWRSGRTGRNGGMPPVAVGVLSSFESVFRWSEKDAVVRSPFRDCPGRGICRKPTKRGRIVPSPLLLSSVPRLCPC